MSDKTLYLELSFMIKINYQTLQASRPSVRPNLLDEQIIKLRRPRFDAALADLKCGNSEHFDFENIITVNLSPSEYLIVEKICCSQLEERIKNAVNEVCRK
jgi:hypothetical protein